MNRFRTLRTILQKLARDALGAFGWDMLTLTRINHRGDLIEIGTEYGGWVIPSSIIGAESVCYCVGCGEDISFDMGLIERFGCDVFAFDPTPRAIKYAREAAGVNEKYHFYEIGLWDEEDTLRFYAPRNVAHVSHSLLNLQKTDDCMLVHVDRLKHIMEKNGHGSIDLLKMDIEGAEYKVIESLVEDKLDVKVICVEYDEGGNPLDRGYKKRIRSSVKSLIENGYALVCAQGNENYTFVKNV